METPQTTPRALQERPWASKRPLGVIWKVSGPHFRASGSDFEASGPHFLPLELNFAHLFLLFAVSPENLDPVDFGAGGRGEAFKSAAPGLTGERSV